MLKKKKAALELSVNSIVILIIAVVVLGLAIGFIQGMFKKLPPQLDRLPEPPAPSSSEPITLSQEKITESAKRTFVMKISIYNPTTENWTSVLPNITCATTDVVQYELQAIPSDIAANTYKTYGVGLKTGAVPKDTYVCAIVVEENSFKYQKDFFVEIT